MSYLTRCLTLLVLGFTIALLGRPAYADVYAECQALLVDQRLAEQGAVLDQALQKFALKDTQPAYFSISGHKVAIIPSDKFGSIKDIIAVSDDLQTINEEWAERWGNVSIINEIKLNNLPRWTGTFAFTYGLGLFMALPYAVPSDTYLTVTMTSTIAIFSYLFSNLLDGPDVASALCRYFQELKDLPGSITETGVFVLKAPPSVIRSLKIFSRFKDNQVTYYPIPWAIPAPPKE